jgi:hypothetical protein
MSLQSIVANAALECNYKYDPATKAKLAALYQSVTGKTPSAKLNILRWFFETFEFNDTDDTWYHRERVLVH